MQNVESKNYIGLIVIIKVLPHTIYKNHQSLLLMQTSMNHWFINVMIIIMEIGY